MPGVLLEVVFISCACLIVQVSLAGFDDDISRADANSFNFVGIVSLFNGMLVWLVEDGGCRVFLDNVWNTLGPLLFLILFGTKIL